MVSDCESKLAKKSISALKMNGISEIPLSLFSLNLQASSYAELGDDTQEKFNILEDRIRENTMLT